MSEPQNTAGTEPGPAPVGRTAASFVPLALLFIMGVTWGLQFTMLKIAADDGFNETGIIALSLVALAPIYAGILAWQGSFFRPTLRHVAFFFVAGGLGYVVPLGAAVHAAPHLPASLVVLVVSLTPVITITAALALRTERVSLLRILAVALGMVATVIVLGADLELPAGTDTFWILIVFIAPLAYGFDGIFIGAFWPKELNALQVVLGETIVAALTMLPFYLLSGEYIDFTGDWRPGHTGLALFVLVSVVEVYIFFYLIRTEGAVLTSFGSFISLFAGVFWGMLIFSERPNQAFWIAVLVLGAALLCVALSQRGVRDGAG